MPLAAPMLCRTPRWLAQTFSCLAAPSLMVAAVPVIALPDTNEAPHFAPWINGTQPDEPETQVQQIDSDTYVIRQSVRTNFEAPFLYLIFGQDRVLLIDTGAGGLAIRPTVDRVIADWRERHDGRPVELIVAHSHGHGDHRSGDGEFTDRPATQVVGLSASDVAAFFGIAPWPDAIAPYDLGERVLQIIPTPGHQDAHIMVYDARTQILFSGDMLYPGRPYVPKNKFADFTASAHRLQSFARTHPIKALLGAHIEMTTTPGQDYDFEAATHPDEHLLPLDPAVIDELAKATDTAKNPPEIDRHDDFIVYPLDPRPAT